MPQYMLVLGGVEPAKKAGVNPEYSAILAKYIAWTEKLGKEGRLRDSHKLKDGQGRRLTAKGGDVVDGPFTETKESIGGYYLIEASSLDEATRIARDCPIFLQGGFVEVREVEF